MFENFTISDFKNLDGNKTASELRIIINKLNDFKKELQEEILERWDENISSKIAGLYPHGKLIDGIRIEFTQKKGRSDKPYPQLNIKIYENGLRVFFILFGYNSRKLNDKYRKISKPFYDNFVTNVKNNLDELNSHEINIEESDLEFEDDIFSKSFYHDKSEIVKLEKNQLFDIIFSDWEKLRPLYDMAISDSYDFADKEPKIIDPPLSEVKPGFIKLLPSEIVKREPKKSEGTKVKKTDHDEENEKNRKTGDRGEILVFRKEKEYLEKIGRMDLIDEIKHISIEDDSAGYDILSFDKKGDEKYIEVKSTTTKVSNVHHFIISSNEYDKAILLENYYIYFVFETNTKNPKIFKLKKPFDLPDSKIEITPANYNVKIGLKAKV